MQGTTYYLPRVLRWSVCLLLLIGNVPATGWSATSGTQPPPCEEENSHCENLLCHRKVMNELLSHKVRTVRLASRNTFHHSYQADRHQTTPRAAEHDHRNGIGAPLLT